MAQKDPFQPVDTAARELAQSLLAQANHAALAVLQPGSALPSVTRIALATDQTGLPLSLISTLSMHTKALDTNPVCALLVGEPGKKVTH